MEFTTTQDIPHRTIRSILGLVTGTDIYLVGGLIGGGLGNQEKLFGSAFSNAKANMEKKAEALGADAIIGVTCSFTSPGNLPNMILVLMGTAVKLEPIAKKEDLPAIEEKLENVKARNAQPEVKDDQYDEMEKPIDTNTIEGKIYMYTNYQTSRSRIIIQACQSFKDSFSVKDLFNYFEYKIPIEEISSILQELEDDNKIIKDSNTKKYSLL